MSALFHYSRQEGYVPLLTANNELGTQIGFDLIYLRENQTYSGCTGIREVGLVVLSGTCTVVGEGFCFAAVGRRSNVFAGLPYAVYLPCNTSYQVSTETWVEIAVCSAPSDETYPVKLLTPDDVLVKALGMQHWRREARFVLDDRMKARSLYIGETILAPGQWTFPPHSHSIDNLPDEVAMAELYFYRTRPADGFGVQLIYTDGGAEKKAYMVGNDDAVVIPYGHHPVVASPGNAMYILWVMAGDRRIFLSRPDARYRWVDNCGM